ncbi:dynamin family protein [Actinosynnema pretiosum]|uniref:dynamin family protein n=1 Tax=Actinosynnema pretiosum TaxID=42197 RepID=UPI0020A41FA9|nr:dynamin family protein [Actinosynnema pretiosum]
MLGDAAEWLRAKSDFDGLPTGSESVELDVDTINRYRTRASSALINIGMVGTFSSGKSFLVSALQGKLDYAPVRGEDGMSSDRYLGLLYSSGRATTVCPASVQPVDDSSGVDASGRGFLRVSFADQPSQWHDIGNSPDQRKLAAYTSSDEQAAAESRSAEHLGRTLAEVEVLISGPEMPAKLYDLPGTESPHALHDVIAERAWQDSDCFVFVTQATRTLSQPDLDLINKLHEHHVRAMGKKVLWVMTGIDRAATIDYRDRAEWQETLARNDAYLRESLHGVDGVDKFIGRGFIPVSAAWEARGRWLRAQGDEGDRLGGENLIARSGMHALRDELRDLIAAGTGRRHLSTVAHEAKMVLVPHHRALVEYLDSARLPLERLATEREDLAERALHLKTAIDALREQLESALRAHLRNVRHSFRGLAGHLREVLADEVDGVDLTKEKEVARLDALKERVLQQWVAHEENGPGRVWGRGYREFTNGVLATVRAAVDETWRVDIKSVGASRVDLDEIMVEPSPRHRTEGADMISTISGWTGISTPVATAVAALATGTPAITGLAAPALVTVLATAIYWVRTRGERRQSSRDLLREEWVDDLKTVADQYCESYLLAAGARGTVLIDRAVELLSQRRDELSLKIIVVESRLAAPGNLDLSETIARLEPLCRKGESLLAELTGFIE